MPYSQKGGGGKIKRVTSAALYISRILRISQATLLLVVGVLLLSTICFLSGCDTQDSAAAESDDVGIPLLEANDIPFENESNAVAALSGKGSAEDDIQEADGEKSADEDTENPADDESDDAAEDEADEVSDEKGSEKTSADSLRAALNISENYRSGFIHGDKSAQYQKYIVLHDTEVNNDANAIVSSWDEDGSGVAAHFIINKDGSIVQCVPLDKIAHHAGFGDAGHNNDYGVQEDGRDDMVGSVPIGGSYPDYGMNAYSVGIELVHVGGSGDYSEAQLAALDDLIAYIDAYYQDQGLENGGTIIDHKTWRTTNSDTSAEFAGYLDLYKNTRRHA